MSGTPTSARDAGNRSELSTLLLQSLEELAAAGNVETACRIAGQACMALHRSDPGGEHRFNALLHRLSRRLSW